MRILLLVLLVGASLVAVAATEADTAAKDKKVVVSGGREEKGEVPVVMTSTGKVSGIREQTTEGKTFFSYYSIPYAKPPVGDLRFRDPQLVSGWGGVRDGSTPPPPCPQLTLVSALTGGNEMVEEEDCLYLNVFTPKPRDQRPHLPVMVFIHGGGYQFGSASEYPPHVLLNEDIVLVTIQYRLNVLGFLSTEDEVVPGNFGLKDQTMALSWIQRNAPKFGGDPLRTTLFGESAGGMSVHLQILTPKSIGLFQRAILQSGTAQCPCGMGARHAEVAKAAGTLSNCPTDEGSEKLVSCLREVEAMKLASVGNIVSEWLFFPILLGPRVDGQYLPADPDFLMKERRHKRVDLMSGITQHDGAIFSLMTYSNEVAHSSLFNDFANKAPVSLGFRPGDVAPLDQTVRIFDRYLKGLNVDAQHADNVTEMYTDRHFAMCHDLTTQLYAKTQAPYKNSTYRYELRHRAKRSTSDLYSLSIGKHWIPHMDDLFYLFEGGDIFEPLEDEVDLKLRKIILKLWTNFAATGNPTPDDSLGFVWEPLKNGDLRYLALQPSPAMEDDYRKETRDFWFSLPTKQNLYLHPELVGNLEATGKDTLTDVPTPTTETPTQVEAPTDEIGMGKDEL